MRKNPIRLTRELRGGPWHGKVVLLPVGGTMMIRVQGQRGRYTEDGYWHERK